MATIITGQSRRANKGKYEPPEYIKTTYAKLVELRDGGGLTPLAYYRITDYCTICDDQDDLPNYVVQDRHPYDLIVQAVSETELKEEACAAMHRGDSYFRSSNLSAWKLKYSLDNDASKFEWARANAKGVVYDMTDEYGNYAPFDFKCIKIAVQKPGNIPPEHADTVGGDTRNGGFFVYAFGNIADGSLTGVYKNNTIVNDYDPDTGQRFITYAQVNGSNNRIEPEGYDITVIGNNNVIKSGCQIVAIYGNNNTMESCCDTINGSFENAKIGANCHNISSDGGSEVEIGHDSANLHLLAKCSVIVHPNTAPEFADENQQAEITGEEGKTKHWALDNNGALTSWYVTD